MASTATNQLFVYGNRAYRSRSALKKSARVETEVAHRIATLDPDPVFVYQVDLPGLHALMTDPVDVRRLTRAHRGATVRLLPVVR